MEPKTERHLTRWNFKRYHRLHRLAFIVLAVAILGLVGLERLARQFPENASTDQTGSPIFQKATYFAPKERTLPWAHVCIIGNAQKKSDAIRSHNMWNDRFISFWFVWGEDMPTTEKLPTNINLLQTEKKMSWADGIYYLLQDSRKSYDCEYIFTHDDDLSFIVKSETDVRPLHQVLTDNLLKHQPAVLGFPWTVGDETIDSMKLVAEIYKDSEVAPLTGFDSGMVLYHKSIVNFFIPYSPRGEGGFTGHWSLCAHFINLFAPLIFHGSALRLNAIAYTNLISFDNIPEDERAPPKVLKNGLIAHGESRHPYEYHMNEPLKVFLSNGMLNRQQHWGRDMGPQDLIWSVDEAPSRLSLEQLTANPLLHRTFDKWMVLDRITQFYDIHHPIISKNMWIRQSFSDAELYSFLKEIEYEGKDFYFFIHIFTLNRQESFNKLWTSINQANPIKRKVAFHIHIDSSKADNNAPFFFYVEKLRSLVSRHGPITVSVHSKPKGLRENILDAWTPLSSQEYGIFLEDDISVSPHFLEYAEQMVGRYLHPRGSPGYSTKCMGISLYNIKFEEVNERDWRVWTGPNFEPYVLQHPQSWGAVYAPTAWNDFRKWFLLQDPSLNPLIPDSLTNRWLKDKSWKKFLIRYMYAKGKFMIYPNLPGHLSLSTNRLEAGTNDKITGPHRNLALKRFNLPLLDLNRIGAGITTDEIGHKFLLSITENTESYKRLNLANGCTQCTNSNVDQGRDVSAGSITPLMPGSLIKYSAHLLPMDKLTVYNAHFQRVSDYKSLTANVDPKAFDKCTLILEHTLQSNEILIEQLKHYHVMSQLESIVVIWNNSEGSPPHLKSPPNKPKKGQKRMRKLKYDYRVPIEFVIPRSYSLNSKYIDRRELQTDCIITTGHRWKIPLYELTYAVSLFQGHFFKNLIGFQPTGHSHAPSSIDPNQWRYIRGMSKKAASLLAYGLVFHKQHLKAYSGAANIMGRMIVDEINGCDDILFNMIVANSTDMGPVVIESPALTPHNSTWRDEIMEERSNCLSLFQRKVFYGKMPLKYTASRFTPPKQISKKVYGVEYPEEVTPSVKKLIFVNSLNEL
ncbi:glycosyl transferase family 64 domain-containing protein [Chytriomyces sp. MP71]|nr:glycosyl transferase family 64 domain-containing protein [Chytriomyces sp. MP71]